ncbi:hypothetical protein C8Q80DRAFT_1168262 [Daedaleopsis nitida]|nr:hypothetical protein C8Q80DRAFT_1168262 [Daedaleopsis nitida]
MGASPAMLRKVQTPKRTPAGPARSLLDMRDRTSWSYSENFAIWDAREYFTLDKDYLLFLTPISTRLFAALSLSLASSTDVSSYGILSLP